MIARERARDWVGKYDAMQPNVRNFIDGAWATPGGAGIVRKYAPRDGRVLVEFAAGEGADVDAAVAAGRRAFRDGRWTRLSSQRRKEVLFKLADLIEANSEELALLDCADVGKPINDALKFDVPIAAAQIRTAAELADKMFARMYAADATSLSYQLRRPVGVVAGIVGWNFPLALASQKIGAVLAVGNSLVLKPSELTSLSAARVAELAMEAGLPSGVFNVVHGRPAIGEALAKHNDIDLITFTGSTKTGKQVMMSSAQSNMKRMVLECGGKAPNIVFDDCPDIDAVSDAILARAFWNQGQVCTASSRVLVHAGIKDTLLCALIKKAERIRIGDPLQAETTFGALVSAGHRDKVLSYIDHGLDEGAQIAFQSATAAPNDSGFYVQPTIFANVSSRHKIAREEIFGPVLSVLAFDDEAEAVQTANDTIYGLSAIVWTKDLGRAHRMTQAIDAGSITINATERPLGGPVMGMMGKGGHKQSGIGVEGGFEGLECLTTNTAVQMFF